MSITVQTREGSVRGVQREGFQQFLGIPFAAPPVGALRFAAPQPVDPGAGELDASVHRASAHQPPAALPGMSVGVQDEDCLYLNVETPAADDARRPVLFWIHGGGFTGGGACQALYRGGAIVRRGDVVLVTINYRLGFFGYLDLPELAGATANAGQLDQIAALEWVQRNIERMGGDPDNVTVFGESAGGMAVSTLLAMPKARGLFHKAIAQSGAASASHDREHARFVADLWLESLGVTRDAPEKLRDLAPEALIAGQMKTAEKVRRGRQFLSTAPIVDGETLPGDPLAAVRSGVARDIPLMTGTTLHEHKLFEIPALMRGFDREKLLRRLKVVLAEGAPVESLVDAYCAARSEGGAPEAAELFSAVQTDRIFRIPAVRLAEAQSRHQPSTYMYLFSWPSPVRRLGACHAIELPFVFGTLEAPTMDRFAGSGPDAERLSLQTMDAWIAFARGADPSHAGLPAWPRYEAERRSTLVLDARTRVEGAPMDAERLAWEGLP